MKAHQLAILSFTLLSNHLQADISDETVGDLSKGRARAKRGFVSCAENFAWKGTNVRVVEDCDILKDQIPVHISKVAENAECIRSMLLDINGEQRRKHTPMGEHSVLLISRISYKIEMLIHNLTIKHT